PNVLEALARCGMEVRVYGLGQRSSFGYLRFYNVDIYRFVEDLAACRGLVSTAGNQLLGEALYLGKPVLAMPEPKNFEQAINAHFLQESGGGVSIKMEECDYTSVRKFLDRADEFKLRFDRNRLHGNPQALNEIKRHLPRMPAVDVPDLRSLHSAGAWA
ncbi:MAG: glycosyltransferase family protein, partial [Candidatus Aminicenantaceae bacterium]